MREIVFIFGTTNKSNRNSMIVGEKREKKRRKNSIKRNSLWLPSNRSIWRNHLLYRPVHRSSNYMQNNIMSVRTNSAQTSFIYFFRYKVSKECFNFNINLDISIFFTVNIFAKFFIPIYFFYFFLLGM